MSKPDQAGGSLEDILSSIRKSLAEQSTDALDEGAVDFPAAEGKPRREGLVGRLANATAGLTRLQEAQQRDDDLSDVLVAEGAAPHASVLPAPEAPVDPAPAATAPAAAPTPAADPAPAPPADKDPLWFLTRSAEPNVAAAEPVLTPPEVVRATMPPFFGAAAEAVGVEMAPAATAAASRSPMFAGAAPGRIADPALDREVSLVAAAAETASRPSGSSAVNGAAGVQAAAASLQAPHALEAMVLELLKPMLRQWLDQNMPRMVAEALKAEADRAAAAEAAAKKP
jgi:cell pole-organizing protein PopZ